MKNDGKAKIVVKIYRNLHKEMDEKVRESRIEVELHQEKVDFYKRCLWERIKILEKGGFRECFNRKWGEGINWVSIRESDFGSQSKESEVRQYRGDNFLFKVTIFRT